MIGFVCGRSGSGKSEWVYARMAEAAESGPVFLLVPDREAVAAESRAAELSGAVLSTPAFGTDTVPLASL